MDTDAVPEGRLPGLRAACVEAPESGPHVERGGEGPVGMVGGGQGRAGHGLDLVADVLQHAPARGTDARPHLREVLVQVADDLALLGALDPRGEVAKIGKQDGPFLEPSLEARPPGQDLIADLAGHVAAEGLPDLLALAEAL